jgi:hypothetical protein
MGAGQNSSLGILLISPARREIDPVARLCAAPASTAPDAYLGKYERKVTSISAPEA